MNAIQQYLHLRVYARVITQNDTVLAYESYSVIRRDASMKEADGMAPDPQASTSRGRQGD